MSLINEHYLKLSKNYFFREMTQKANAYKATHPEARIISFGIGDVTQPLAPAVIEAMHRAVDDEATKARFHGYGPEQGYPWLREAIVKNHFLNRGISIDPSEIFISDGAKTDTSNIGELLRWDNSMAVTDPIYPVYVDSNVMNGRAGKQGEDGRWSNVTYMACNEANGFKPQLPDHRVDIIYLCYPNNPTGMVLTKDELRQWVNYAIKNDAIIFYDAAYQAYIQHPDIPHSIYEIRGAKKVAIEFHSYSKTAGFTGIRCGYTVVPKEVTAASMDGSERFPLHPLWLRRTSTKFNGASYISQRAAEAIYTEEGREQVAQTIQYYMDNAHLMRQRLTSLGLQVYGGEDAPYLWLKAPRGMTSWQMVDHLLYGAQVICTPGMGFGPSGEGFVRLTSFCDRADCEEALDRIARLEKG